MITACRTVHFEDVALELWFDSNGSDYTLMRVCLIEDRRTLWRLPISRRVDVEGTASLPHMPRLDEAVVSVDRYVIPLRWLYRAAELPPPTLLP